MYTSNALICYEVLLYVSGQMLCSKTTNGCNGVFRIAYEIYKTE